MRIMLLIGGRISHILIEAHYPQYIDEQSCFKLMINLEVQKLYICIQSCDPDLYDSTSASSLKR